MCRTSKYCKVSYKRSIEESATLMRRQKGTFTRHSIDRVIPVDSLVKCKIRTILSFSNGPSGIGTSTSVAQSTMRSGAEELPDLQQ